MNRWVLAATLTVCGAMMMLTSCTDAIGSTACSQATNSTEA